MKHINNIIIKASKVCLVATALLSLTTSCSDLLEKNPPSEISNGNFWTGESDAKLALVGCYRFQTG